MKNSLWLVITLSGVFLGFGMGYATPPMVETGMLTGKGAPPKVEKADELKKFYQDLYK
ncbi:MAG: hypothetical protein OEM83_08430 [Gammaproteobacteria bacterium]|nr:hypothetical protein [Gammaproteobacteria bacterium]MDH5512328.1 hypothetical protein [Gammaproteobacteria bacterium]